MTDPRYYGAVEGTWPAVRCFSNGPFTLREGGGGGSRVSAATLTALPDGQQRACSDEDVAQAARAMADMGQSALFMVRDGEVALDAQLARLGYEIKDPVNLWTCAPESLLGPAFPPLNSFCIWEPLAVQDEIWAEGGIGPERRAIMARAAGPKTSIFGRCDDQPAATAYVAIQDGIAMLHALEVRKAHRRKGMGLWMMRRAAQWAGQQGATEFCVLCTKANAGANALYRDRLAMGFAGEYHYRVLS